MTVANFALTYAKGLLDMGMARTVPVDVSEDKSGVFDRLAVQALEKDPNLGTTEVWRRIQLKARVLGLIPQHRRAIVDIKCAIAENTERSVAFLLGFYGLLLLLINGFHEDLTSEKAVTLLSWANTMFLAGLVWTAARAKKELRSPNLADFEPMLGQAHPNPAQRRLLIEQNLKAYLEEIQVQASTTRSGLFTRIALTWSILACALFLLSAAEVNLWHFPIGYADHLAVVCSVILIAGAFILHFASRHILIWSLNRDMNKQWNELKSKLESLLK